MTCLDYLVKELKGDLAQPAFAVVSAMWGFSFTCDLAPFAAHLARQAAACHMVVICATPSGVQHLLQIQTGV